MFTPRTLPPPLQDAFSESRLDREWADRSVIQSLLAQFVSEVK